MRKPFALTASTCLCLGLLVALAPAQRRGDRGDFRSRTPVELKNFSWTEKSFHSKSLDRDMPYGIYLPKGYDDPENEDKRYPLVIWLHGMFEDHQRFHHRGGAPILDRVAGTEGFPEVVFVSANGGRSFYINGLESGRWEDLIKVDLLEHLTKEYRVSEDRRMRAIMGISMGGMGALKIAFKHPELFGTVAVHSAAVFPEDPKELGDRLRGFGQRLGMDKIFGEPIDMDLWRQENPLCIAKGLDEKKLDGLRIYFDAGTEDRYGFGQSNALLDRALTASGIDHTWELVEGGGHAWGSGFKDSSLEASLHFVGKGILAAEGVEKGKAGLKGLLPAGTGGDKGKKGGGNR